MDHIAKLLFLALQPLNHVHHLELHTYLKPHRKHITTTSTAIMYRQTMLRQARLFSTSVRVRKSAVDQAKEALSSVDKSVAQTIVKGIEKGGTYTYVLVHAQAGS